MHAVAHDHGAARNLFDDNGVGFHFSGAYSLDAKARCPYCDQIAVDSYFHRVDAPLTPQQRQESMPWGKPLLPPADWNAPVPGTGPDVFADVAASLSRGFRGADRLYGFAHHSVSTTFCGGAPIVAGVYRAPSRPRTVAILSLRWRSSHN